MKVFRAARALLEHNSAFFRNRRRAKNCAPRPVDYRTIVTTMRTDYDPVFCLSPGRSGTAYLSEALTFVEGVDVYHAPDPQMIHYSRFAFENQSRHDLLDHVFLAGRLELVQASYVCRRTYVETNNRITFFAPSILRLFPRARFVQLTRHPAAFVRSGVVRGWYDGSTAHDAGRLVPAHVDQWDEWSRVRQVAWLWNTTHEFIEEFLQFVPSDQKLTVRAEDMFGNVPQLDTIDKFICQRTPRHSTKYLKMVGKKVNRQDVTGFPPYSQWSTAQRDDLSLEVDAALAHKLGYSL